VTMTTKAAATRYGRALFDVAHKEQTDLDRTGADLAAFSDLIENQPALKKVLLNPAVPVVRKRAAVEQLAHHAGVLPIVAKLLALLAERDRLIVLPDLVKSYRERLFDYRRIVRAEVTTAAPLDSSKTTIIEQQLAHATGRTVLLQTRVDPAIIGGLVAKVGSTVYDASITRQLERMKQRLIERI
jgi:F-type H+-transporting ATPase subunit delta